MATKKTNKRGSKTGRRAGPEFDAAHGSAVGGDFYRGVEWLACWLLDNAEGETIEEDLLRGWAIEAWRAHLKRQNRSR